MALKVSFGHHEEPMFFIKIFVFVQLQEEWLSSNLVTFFLHFFVSKVCSKTSHFDCEELGFFMALGANS